MLQNLISIGGVYMGSDNEFMSSFIKQIGEDDLVISDNGLLVETLEEKAFGSLLLEYEKVVVKSLVTSFGLDFLMFSDKIGGEVQTLHNAKNGVFSDKKYEERFNQNYDRKQYEDTKAMKSYKKEQFKNNEKVYSGYTNREVNKDGSTHTEHIYSAGEYHRNDKARLFQSNERRKEVINDDKNFTLLESNINQSKGDQNMQEFLDKKKRGEEKANAERFGIDRQQATQKYDDAKTYVNKQVMYDEIKHYSSEVTKKGVASAAKMGLRQCLGIIFAEVWMTVREELPHTIRELKEDFELDELLKKTTDIVKKAFENIKSKYKELLDSFRDGAIAGFLSTLSSTIINIFFTTAKSVGRILRNSWSSIVEAVKILVLNPDKLPFGEQIKAVSKIIATCISVICGSLIQEALSKIIPTIPVLSDVLPLFIGTMVTGIMTVSFMYFLDNSDKVKKIVNYLNQLKSKAELTLEYYKEVNKKLNVYVANLVSIDIKEFEKEIEDVRQINRKLSSTTDLNEFSNILYKELNTRGIKLQFTNFEEFDDFMKDKNSILII